MVYHTDSFDYVVVVDNEAYDLEISIHTPYEKLEIRPSSFGIVPFVKEKQSISILMNRESLL